MVRLGGNEEEGGGINKKAAIRTEGEGQRADERKRTRGRW